MTRVYLPDGEEYEPNLTDKMSLDSITYLLKVNFPNMLVVENENGDLFLM